MVAMATMPAVAVPATVAPRHPRRAGDGDLDGGEAWALFRVTLQACHGCLGTA